MEKAEFHQLIKDAEHKLREAGIEAAATEVEIILQSILDVERIAIYLHGWTLIDNHTLEKFNNIVARRATRYPLQYILGEAYFYGRKFLVDPDVMVPIPETELLCELAVNYVRNESIESPQTQRKYRVSTDSRSGNRIGRHRRYCGRRTARFMGDRRRYLASGIDHGQEKRRHE